jgi:uncharacterized protein (TIGR02594 family)
MSIEPAWLTEARRNMGVQEVVGPRHNPTIMGWIAKMGARVLGISVTSDETAWCGTFVAWCMFKVGIEPPKIAVRAKEWASPKWGRILNDPRLGCVCVFDRKGGGHVGFYIGEDRTHLHILGGNQGNRVSITRIPKTSLVAMTWPRGVDLPLPNRIWLNAAGVPTGESQA